MNRGLTYIHLTICGLLSSLSIHAGTAAGMTRVETDSHFVVADSSGDRNDSIPEDVSLQEVVITATRTPKTLKDVPVVTRVITSEDISKADATNIQDLLTEELPGLEFGYAMSQETSLNMSGFGGSSVLFLVDGERLAGETMDNVDYKRLNLDNVGHVEIVKGASSALYGANAVGGVVNLITQERTEPWHLNINGRYKGFGNEWRAGGDMSFNTEKWNSNTTLQYTSSETVRLTDPFDTESKIHEVFGGKTFNVKERLIFRASDRLRFIARGGYFSRKSFRANYDDNYKDYTGGLRSIWEISKIRPSSFHTATISMTKSGMSPECGLTTMTTATVRI